MGPQHIRSASPTVKTCLARKCEDLQKGTTPGGREGRLCQLTDRIPGHMTECPKDHGKNCPKLQGCPLLRTGMACSLCMNMIVNSPGCA